MTPLAIPQLVRKLSELERALTERHGDFTLFALLLREEAPGVWDVVVSAEWLGTDPMKPIRFMVGEIRSRIGTAALLRLSRVVCLRPTDPIVRSFLEAFTVVHGRIEIYHREIAGIDIREGFIITAQRVPRSRRARRPARAR